MALARDIGRLFSGGSFTDVKVAITSSEGGATTKEVLDLHRNVLATRSDYFQSRLLGGYSDGSDETLKLELAPGSSTAATKALLQYLYTDSIKITEGIVMEILSGADNLQLVPV
jgi:hypothetical protein